MGVRIQIDDILSLFCKFCLEIGYKLQGVIETSHVVAVVGEAVYEAGAFRSIPPELPRRQEQNNLLNYPSLTMRLLTTFNRTY